MATPPAEPLSDQPTSQPVTTILPAPTTTFAEMEADARKTIAHRLVFAYIILLAFSIVIPMALIWIPHVTNTFSVTDARDMMLAMSGALSGLVGILGFVMGYYFKALDKSPETAASSKPPRRVGSAASRTRQVPK